MNTPSEMNQPVPPTNAKLTHAILINGHRIPVATQMLGGDMLLYTAIDLREFEPIPSYAAAVMAADGDVEIYQYVGAGDWMRIYKARLVLHSYNSNQPKPLSVTTTN